MQTQTLLLASLAMAMSCGGKDDDSAPGEADADTDADADADADADTDADTDTDTDWLGSLQGRIYVQQGQLGFASYHFDAPDDIYIDYSDAPAHWVDDDGGAFPDKKLFIEASFDEKTRTFLGKIDWSDPEGTTVAGAEVWDYTMVFAKDYSAIVGGGIEPYGPDGKPFGKNWTYPDDLDYVLYEKPGKLDCPTPSLAVNDVGYAFEGGPPQASIHLLFSAGFSDAGEKGCFSDGTQLYNDSRIELSTPKGKLRLSLPGDYKSQPSGLATDPIRNDGDPTLNFGDIMGDSELVGDLTSALKAEPAMDGFVRLCNANGECDELDFTFEEQTK